ncbi:hypothetical protein [Flavobacterium succinicans]|uniref:Uncharacterized protein n=1 Tax=Flavobacterium succinicans TaxID=29536 RepID=A0A199XS84_9FLAO|nr:hypothetical protein [Flavobacterium succinicans]OAZ04505.1 hypothetical protein FLB_11000 [Flavobacterium succinicans]
MEQTKKLQEDKIFKLKNRFKVQEEMLTEENVDKDFKQDIKNLSNEYRSVT